MGRDNRSNSSGQRVLRFFLVFCIGGCFVFQTIVFVNVGNNNAQLYQHQSSSTWQQYVDFTYLITDTMNNTTKLRKSLASSLAASPSDDDEVKNLMSSSLSSSSSSKPTTTNNEQSESNNYNHIASTIATNQQQQQQQQRFIHNKRKQKRRRSLIDFHKCSSSSSSSNTNNLPSFYVTPKVDKSPGFGHRLTQALGVMRIALIEGYCFCWDHDSMKKESSFSSKKRRLPKWYKPPQDDNVIFYNLILKPLFPLCPNTTTTTTTTNNENNNKGTGFFDELFYLTSNLKEGIRNFTTSSTTASINKDISSSSSNNNISLDTTTTKIFKLYLNDDDVWRKNWGDRGSSGGILDFTDRFLHDTHLLEDVIYPYYLSNRDQVFSSSSSAANTTTITKEEEQEGEAVLDIKVAIHLRVGDMALDREVKYWKNIFNVIKSICTTMSEGTSTKTTNVNIYFIYSQSRVVNDHESNIGKWPSSKENRTSLLPKSHLFLEDLCNNVNNNNNDKDTGNNNNILHINCYWKNGVSFIESIDLLMTSDIVYVSGSSFSQTATLFNPYGKKIIAIPKEVLSNNYSFRRKRNKIPKPTFLLSHSNSFNSLQYYYVNVNGTLYEEQSSFLNL